MIILHLLDYFFVILHTAVIIINLFGWIWRPTRRLNLALLLLTGLSWTVLGIFYGPGYCPLTEWHWDILEKLGHHDLPSSYVSYLIFRLTGIELHGNAADLLTGGTFLPALMASLYVNIRDHRRQHKPQ